MKQIVLLGTLAVTVLLSGNLWAGTERFKGYNFRARVIKAGQHRFYKEFKDNGKEMINVRPNEEYSIKIYNPLPVRVAVALSIDGLNSIDGKRTSPGKAQKWIIDPHSSITVKGWQTGKDKLRKFIFTEDRAAYAQWRQALWKKYGYYRDCLVLESAGTGLCT